MQGKFTNKPRQQARELPQPAAIQKRHYVVFDTHRAPGLGGGSMSAAPQQRELFGIDHVPVKVREHGLRDAHTWPLVSKGKRGGAYRGSFRVPAAEAWGFPEIELRAGNSWPCIILDLDGANALYRVVDAVEHGEVKTPNWTVTRKASGGVLSS